MKMLCVQLLLLLCLLNTCQSHLCLISPRQRGDMDITSAGSHTCFRHGAPCGGMPAETSNLQIIAGGQQMFIKWQQNFNHYEVGYPGFMDISIAPVDSDNFTLLSFVPDKYVFAQDHQQNYTAVITAPNIQCDHCVIRARYQSHKAGETIFYQCADVKITKSSGPFHKTRMSAPFDPNFRTLQKATELQMEYPMHEYADASFNLQGLAYNEFEPDRLHFVNVSLDLGVVQPLNEFNIGVDLTRSSRRAAFQQPNFLMDGIAALNPTQSEMLTIYHHGGSMDNVASEVMVIFTNNGKLELTTALHGFDGVPINALEYVKPRTYVSFGIQENKEKPGTFHFILGQITYVPGTGLVYKQIYRSPDTENLFVNFQWASMDRVSGELFVLMGNENTPDTLDARIYVYNFFNQSFIKMVPVQKSDYTFMSIHVYRPGPQTPFLYAVAPEGSYSEKRPAWSLIRIDPVLGTVMPLFQISPPGVFERYYGGSIFNGFDQTNGVLYHVLRVADTVADVIVSVDVRGRTTTFSRLTNLRHIHNLSLSPK
ncbi:uncharacterized protein LOC117327830 [Pecten maximus]|uniref:uncharacterized protein LOC117327830 n=1 Tax=Pecten maximus TaxID=6579 RepID=UPI0014591234|nr:uncharacterized protein LOC117327830 [Pecten maximus]